MIENQDKQNKVFSSSQLEEMVDVRRILVQLYHHRWFICAAVLCGFIIAFFYTLTMVPQYRTAAMIKMNIQGNNNAFSEMGLTSNAPSQVDSILTLIQTSYILEPIIKENALNIGATPRYFPIIGNWKARRYQGKGLAKPFFWLRSYAWGGEEIQIKKFIMPAAFEGQSFKLIVGKENSYKLYNAKGGFVLSGKVGTPSTNKDFILEISHLKAREHTQFFIKSSLSHAMVQSLADHLKIDNIPSVAAMQKTSGVFRLQLTGTDPVQIVKILNAIVNYVVEENIKEKTSEAQKTLKFLYQRLPELKQSLRETESSLNRYRSKIGVLDVTETGPVLMNELSSIEKSLETLASQKIILLETYTPAHPLVLSIKHQEEELTNKLNNIKNKIKDFPVASQEESNMKTEAEIKSTLYSSMLKSIQEFEITQAGIIGDIKALNGAAPAVILPSKKPFILFTGLFIGLLLSSLAVIVKTIFTKLADDPDRLEEDLQLPVQAIIPYSKAQKRMEKNHQNSLAAYGTAFASPIILAKEEPNDIATESLRSLHISLQILSSVKTNNIIAILGTASGIGKSFVSLNLAQIIALSGKKTLLIDADIRKGRLHHSLQKPKSPGLSEFLENKHGYENLIHHIHDNLYYLACGKYTRHPSELFQGNQLETLLNQAKNDFDQIVIDTPPILPVSDSILIAKYASTILFVVNASKDSLAAVKHGVKKAKAHSIEINGLVLNHRQAQTPYGYGYGYYYSYNYGHKSNKKLMDSEEQA